VSLGDHLPPHLALVHNRSAATRTDTQRAVQDGRRHSRWRWEVANADLHRLRRLALTNEVSGVQVNAESVAGTFGLALPDEPGPWAWDVDDRIGRIAVPNDGTNPLDVLDRVALVRVGSGQLRLCAADVATMFGTRVEDAELSLLVPASPASVAAPGPATTTDDPLTDEIFDAWSSSIDGGIHETTNETYRGYARVWLPLFKTFGGLLRGGAMDDFTNARLKGACRRTVLKEQSALRGFLRWAKACGHIDRIPEIQPPPPKATGTRDPNRRLSTVDLSPEEVLRWIAALPEFANRARRGKHRHPVREYFLFAWETALRPGTLARMSVPEHWTRGSRTLRVTDAIDKARFGRKLKLTDAALAVLERHAPESGLIFGKHDYRSYFHKAALAAGIDEARARDLAPYDLRHARAQYLLDVGGTLSGVGYALGHKRTSTTDIYTGPSERQHDKLLAQVAAAESSAAAKASSASVVAAGIGGSPQVVAEGVLDDRAAAEYTSDPTRRWRNWQTHWIQVPAG